MSLHEINHVNERQLSLLQIAAREGQLHHVLMLLKDGANVNQSQISGSGSEYLRNNSIKSPLYFALEREHHLIAAILFIAGADKEAAMKTACSLNDFKVQQQLRSLKVDHSILKAMLAWAIKEEIYESTPLFQNLMLTVTASIQLSHEVRLSISDGEEKSDAPEDIEHAFTKKDIASFIEFSAYFNVKHFIKAFSSFGVAHRYDPTIRNAAYWYALKNNTVIQGASTDDIGLMLSQLYQDKHISVFAHLLKQASPKSRDHFKCLDKQLNPRQARSLLLDLELNMANQDWVALSLNAKENRIFPQLAYSSSSPALKAFVLIYNGEDMYENLLTLKDTPYSKAIAEAFPGLFNYVMGKQINVYRAYQLCPFEKAMITHCRLTEQQRENFINSSIQDRHDDIAPPMQSSLFATYSSALSIPHKIAQPRNYFISLGNDTTHLIIHYLNADDHHSLEQTNRLFRRLVQANEHRKTRLVLRANGREYAESVKLRQSEFAEYMKLCRQLVLMSQFLEDEQKEFERVGFFKRNKVRIISALATLIVVSMITTSSYFFHELDGEKESIKETMRHVDYSFNSLTSTCIDFVSRASGFGCDGYDRCDGYECDPSIPAHVDPLCQPYCDELQSLYPGWGASLAGIIIPVSLLFLYWVIDLCRNYHDSEYAGSCAGFEKRWDRTKLSNHSEALQNAVADVDVGGYWRSRSKTLGDFKALIQSHFSSFSTRKTLLAEKLGINPNQVIPVVNEEKAAEPELQPHIAGLDEGLDAPLLQHPGL